MVNGQWAWTDRCSIRAYPPDPRSMVRAVLRRHPDDGTPAGFAGRGRSAGRGHCPAGALVQLNKQEDKPGIAAHSGFVLGRVRAELGLSGPRVALAYNLLAVVVRVLPSRWVSFTIAGSQPILADLPKEILPKSEKVRGYCVELRIPKLSVTHRRVLPILRSTHDEERFIHALTSSEPTSFGR